MKTYSIGDFKANLSEILDMVRKGEEIALTYGKKKEVVAYLVPKEKKASKAKRPIGLLEGKAKVIFMDDFEMTEEEFLGL